MLRKCCDLKFHYFSEGGGKGGRSFTPCDNYRSSLLNFLGLVEMKHLLLTTIAALVLVGRGKSITIHELPRGNPEEVGMSSEGLKK